MAKRGISITALLVGIGLALGVAPTAAAQPTVGGGDNANSGSDHFRRDRNTSVVQRRKERDDGLGWRAGSFRVKPQLDLMIGHTDNFAAAETNPESSTVYEIDGRLDVESDWGRHALYASLFVPTTGYTGEFSATDYVATLGGRYDVDHSFILTGGIAYGDRTEPFGFTDSGISLEEPLRYYDAEAHVGFSKTFNRLRIAGRVAYRDLDFQQARLSNGTPITFDERDVSTITYGLRADYAVSDATSIFVSAGANERDHDLDPPDVPFNLDSQGQEYLVGANFDITRVMRGEIAVGALMQTYDDPGLEDQEDFAARGQVEWFPDELVTVTLGLERAIGDSRSVNAATYVGTATSLDVDYEFRRNIILSMRAGYASDEYNEIDRDDTRWSVHAGAEYEMNRNVSFTLTAGHIEQSSDGVDAGRNYDANVGLFGVRLRR